MGCEISRHSFPRQPGEAGVCLAHRHLVVLYWFIQPWWNTERKVSRQMPILAWENLKGQCILLSGSVELQPAFGCKWAGDDVIGALSIEHCLWSKKCLSEINSSRVGHRIIEKCGNFYFKMTSEWRIPRPFMENCQTECGDHPGAVRRAHRKGDIILDYFTTILLRCETLCMHSNV